MTECDTICPDPGACCRDFPIPQVRNGTALDVMVLLASRMYGAGEEQMPALGMPFVPKRFDAENGCWRFDCINLRWDGRCADYENRPYSPCVMYQVRQCSMCALWEE